MIRMIVPDAPATAAHVALHYDELDPVYRRLWGDHVHHGYWRDGGETADQAVAALVTLVEDRLALEAGQAICDIGCGYGATAAALAGRHDVSILGLTLSVRQKAVADGRVAGFSCLVRDWMDNGLDGGAFDAAYAIESSEHMPDKQRFFTEARRILRPGGRLVVCAWLEGEATRPWQVRHLLLPICREGRLPSMGSQDDYAALAARAGFVLRDYQDISRQVRRTWSICLWRLLKGLATDRSLRGLAFNRATQNRDFMLTLPRLILAMRTGAMRYGIFQWEAR